MLNIDAVHIKEMTRLGFKTTFTNGYYLFANKNAGEGFTVRNDGNEYQIQNFAFINGEQVEGEAASESIVEGIKYIEEVLGIDQPEQETKLGTHAAIVTGGNDGRANDTSLITERDFELQTTSRNTLLMMQKTDPKYIRSRKGKGQAEVKYVDVQYMTRALNFTFGFNWSFDVLETRQEDNYLSVLGKLTVNLDGATIFKTQWGSQELRAKMELGDGLKAATSDALKKCASMFGIAADVYAGEV